MSVVAASRSETTKVFTTSSWWVLAVVLVLYVGSLAAGMAWLFGAISTGQLTGSDAGAGAPPVAASTLPLTMFSIATSVGYVFPLLVGTLMVTNEFRHQTLTPTFLATPRRGVALTGKLVAAVVVGLLYGVIAIVAVVTPSASILASFGIATTLDDSETWLFLARSLLALVLWTIIGVGVGALVRNQVAAIVIVLAFTQFIEPILRIAGGFIDWLNEVTKFLPGAASDALAGGSFYSSLGGAAGPAMGALDWWQGGLVLLGYAIAFTLLGQLFSWRRDVT